MQSWLLAAVLAAVLAAAITAAGAQETNAPVPPAPASTAPSDAPLPAAADLVRKVLARDEIQQIDLERYQYSQKAVTEKLDDAGKVLSSSEVEMLVKPGEANDFVVVSNGNGATLAPEQVSEKDRKAAWDSEKLKASFSLRRLATRFDIAVEGRDTWEGRPAYVVSFTPRKGQPYTNRIEKILNNLKGRIWVSAEDYSIFQTKATLSKPTGMAWLFATMQSLDFLFRVQPIPSGYGPAEFDIDFRVSVMGGVGSVRQRQAITMYDYQLR